MTTTMNYYAKEWREMAARYLQFVVGKQKANVLVGRGKYIETNRAKGPFLEAMMIMVWRRQSTQIYLI